MVKNGMVFKYWEKSKYQPSPLLLSIKLEFITSAIDKKRKEPW
jgi:hypothetical protein